MKIIKCKDYEEMSKKAAELTAESVRNNPEALISFPGGDTPLGTVHTFADMVNSGAVDISKAYYVSLDEWVGLSVEDQGSCALFNREEFLNRLEKPFADMYLIDGKAEDVENEPARLNQFIEKHGPLDVSVLGIGMNGHLGLNEDGAEFSKEGHIAPLSETTMKVMQKYFDGKYHPTHGITQGISQIMAAKKVILIVNGAHKADIIYEAVRGEVTNKIPASILQEHPDCCLIVDEEAGAKL